MNAALAKNVRTLRDAHHWTQQHLADTAGILIRTVQRVENGDGASADTLGALSNAFDVPIDVLQTDIDAFVAKAQQDYTELQKTHDIVPVKLVKISADLNVLERAKASLVQCTSDDDTAQDATAALRSNIQDMIDIWDDVDDPVAHRKWIREVFGQVEELNKLGFVVSVGERKTSFRGVAFPTLYLIVAHKDDARGFIAVDKDLLP